MLYCSFSKEIALALVQKKELKHYVDSSLLVSSVCVFTDRYKSVRYKRPVKTQAEDANYARINIEEPTYFLNTHSRVSTTAPLIAS
jgi:hypothetical protein